MPQRVSSQNHYSHLWSQVSAKIVYHARGKNVKIHQRSSIPLSEARASPYSQHSAIYYICISLVSVLIHLLAAWLPQTSLAVQCLCRTEEGLVHDEC